MFLLEPFFGEPSAESCRFHNLTERLQLGFQVSSLQAKDAVWQGILAFFGNVLADNLDQVGQGHDGSADNKVIAAFLVFTAQVLGVAVLQADGVAHFLGDAYLLACAVDKLELAFGKEDGQGYAGESAARTEVEDAGAGTEVYHAGNGHRVEHMVLVEVVDVLARNDINLGIPVPIQRVERSKLLLLLGAEVGEVFLNDFHH